MRLKQNVRPTRGTDGESLVVLVAARRSRDDDPAVLRHQGVGAQGRDLARLTARRAIAALAALKLGLHLAVNAVTPYGFHRDELLYLAMGRHLRLWAMDFPPAIALLADAVRATLGDSLAGPPPRPRAGRHAGAGARRAHRARARRRALGTDSRRARRAASPLFLRSANLFQPVVLDQLAWTVALYALVRLCRAPAPAWWIVLGGALGFGLLAKFSAAFLGARVGARAAHLLAACVAPDAVALGWPR